MNGVEKIIKEKILRFNVVNSIHRIYTKDSISGALEKYQKVIDKNKSYGCIGFNRYGISIHVEDISHRVEKLYIEGEYLVAEIKVLMTRSGHLLNEILDSVVFRMAAIGKENSDKLVNIEEILYINAILKSEDSFNNIFTKKN